MCQRLLLKIISNSLCDRIQCCGFNNSSQETSLPDKILQKFNLSCIGHWLISLKSVLSSQITHIKPWHEWILQTAYTVASGTFSYHLKVNFISPEMINISVFWHGKQFESFLAALGGGIFDSAPFLAFSSVSIYAHNYNMLIFSWSCVAFFCFNHLNLAH